MKIGKADDLKKRLSSLQTGHWDELKILCVIKTYDKMLELKLHRYFSKYRLRGEWFKPDILNFLYDLAKQSIIAYDQLVSIDFFDYVKTSIDNLRQEIKRRELDWVIKMEKIKNQCA